jgi:hypothetical protein
VGNAENMLQDIIIEMKRRLELKRKYHVYNIPIFNMITKINKILKKR